MSKVFRLHFNLSCYYTSVEKGTIRDKKKIIYFLPRNELKKNSVKKICNIFNTAKICYVTRVYFVNIPFATTAVPSSAFGARKWF